MTSHEFAKILLRLPEHAIGFSAAGQCVYPEDIEEFGVYLVDNRCVIAGEWLEPPPGTPFVALWEST